MTPKIKDNKFLDPESYQQLSKSESSQFISDLSFYILHELSTYNIKNVETLVNNLTNQPLFTNSRGFIPKQSSQGYWLAELANKHPTLPWPVVINVLPTIDKGLFKHTFKYNISDYTDPNSDLFESLLISKINNIKSYLNDLDNYKVFIDLISLSIERKSKRIERVFQGISNTLANDLELQSKIGESLGIFANQKLQSNDQRKFHHLNQLGVQLSRLPEGIQANFINTCIKTSNFRLLDFVSPLSIHFYLSKGSAAEFTPDQKISLKTHIFERVESYNELKNMKIELRQSLSKLNTSLKNMLKDDLLIHLYTNDKWWHSQCIHNPEQTGKILTILMPSFNSDVLKAMNVNGSDRNYLKELSTQHLDHTGKINWIDVLKSWNNKNTYNRDIDSNLQF